MAKPSKVASWLKSAKPKRPTKCTICLAEETAAAVLEFHEAKKAKRTAVTWAQFVRDFLTPNGLTVRTDVLYQHLKNCLGGGST